MPLAALVVGGALLGAASLPHCLAMCGASSAAVMRGCGFDRGGPSRIGFHLGRLAGYMAAGALAATGLSALRAFGDGAPLLRPIWSMLHVAALALGLWLLWRGRQPAWLAAWPARRTASPRPDGWQRLRGPTQAFGAGMAWVAWPCGVLQSALVVAALADGALGGAMVMAAFAMASSPALMVWTVPGSVMRWVTASAWASGALPVRLGGAALVAGSAWALGHGLWVRVAAFCLN